MLSCRHEIVEFVVCLPALRFLLRILRFVILFVFLSFFSFLPDFFNFLDFLGFLPAFFLPLVPPFSRLLFFFLILFLLPFLFIIFFIFLPVFLDSFFCCLLRTLFASRIFARPSLFCPVTASLFCTEFCLISISEFLKLKDSSCWVSEIIWSCWQVQYFTISILLKQRKGYF